MCTTCPRAWPGASAPSCWVRARRGHRGRPSLRLLGARVPPATAAPRLCRAGKRGRSPRFLPRGWRPSARYRFPETAARWGRLPEGRTGQRRCPAGAARLGMCGAGWGPGTQRGLTAGFLTALSSGRALLVRQIYLLWVQPLLPPSDRCRGAGDT